MKSLSTSQRPTKFGMFYPRGYVIVTFRNEESADAVRQSLIDGGYEEEDILRMETSSVLEGSTADLEHLNPLIEALGSETDLMEGHKMNVACRHGYLRARMYDRFSFTEL